MKRFLSLLSIILALCSTSEGSIPNKTADLGTLTVQQKVGQLMMIGFKERYPTEGLKKQIQSMNVGGVILFPRNIENPKQVRLLTKSISALNKSPLPMFIATDEEGGRVIRFYKDNVTMPGNMALGATGSKKLAYEAGRSIAARLLTLGININLAPVLDLNFDSDNRIVGSRSFGEDPLVVASLGNAYIRGVQSLGVSATAKHFPGHGRTKVDSHKRLPKINSNLTKDLIPFREAIKENVDLIMTAHISFPKLDKSGVPATLSKEIITNLLRKKMKYNGVIITDDLEMGAIEHKFGVGEAAVRAIIAGSDIVIVGWHSNKQMKVYKALLAAVKSKRISMKRLDSAVDRILKLKSKRLNKLKNEEYRTEAEIIINSTLQGNIARKITTESATVLKNRENTLPLETDEKVTLVVSPLYELFREIRKRANNVFYIELEIRPTEIQRKKYVDYIKKVSEKVDQIVIGVINKYHAEIVAKIRKGIDKPLIVVSFDSPHYISGFPDVDAFLCVYHYRTGAAEAAARVILGDLKSKGTLPVSHIQL